MIVAGFVGWLIEKVTFLVQDSKACRHDIIHSVFLRTPFKVSNSQHFAVPHNHESEDERIEDARQKGFLSMKTLGEASLEYDVKSSIKVELIREESAQ